MKGSLRSGPTRFGVYERARQDENFLAGKPSNITIRDDVTCSGGASEFDARKPQALRKLDENQIKTLNAKTGSFFIGRH